MLQTIDKAEETDQVLAKMGREARKAARQLATASADSKEAALRAMAASIEQDRERILEANEIDVRNAHGNGVAASFIDRLQLDDQRLAGVAEGLLAIADLPDPVGRELASWTRPNGLRIARVATPLGVVGVIYESRPNVTADAGALCLKAGNAVILRGGSDSINSSIAIHASLAAGLREAGLPATAIQIVRTTDRAAVGAMLSGLQGAIDVIVPRGGRSLVQRVQDEARVPVFAHLEGLVHIYVDGTADVGMAADIVVNSKMRRTGICGALETLLIERAATDTHLGTILDRLSEAGCEIRGDETVRAAWPSAKPATDEDWATEYLDAIVSVRVVDGVEGAIEHIRQWSSDHTEAILSSDAAAVETFMNSVDSAILLHNVSTQFADGGEFGMGAEIGIATGKMHARGPVGVEQLTSFNYRVRGSGQVRG